MTDKISLQMARNMMLAAQGLGQPSNRPTRKAGVLEAVRRMCLLQIDTINVVARSPYLVLWSRLGDYQREWLDELLAEGALFEYWSHAMCFIPIWDRHRARELFDFDYTIECYTPAAKCRYGYFTLPILHRGRLIGRLDPKAHRAQGVFEIKALHLEPGVQVDEKLVADLAAVFHRLADWHGTPDLVVHQSDPPELATLLAAAM